MGRELWAELSAVISLVELDFCDNPDVDLPTVLIVRCHVWSVIHERPTCWACKTRNWDRLTRPPLLPSQSTMSRRLRRPDFEAFMTELARRLHHLPQMGRLFKRLDAKALPVAAHSKDPDAGWGRGAGQMSNGYKLHAILDNGAMPLCWRIAPLNISEQEMARRMLRELESKDVPGVISADANYDVNLLYAQAAAADNRLIAPRKKPGTGLGHRTHHEDRVRCLEMLEGPTSTLSGMGPTSVANRPQIERDFGNLVSFGGGLQGLPSWARRHGRVRRWVWAKLMINAARIRLLKRHKSNDCA